MRLLFEVVKLALDTLRGNKVRSFLTILGVIIGTSTMRLASSTNPTLAFGINAADEHVAMIISAHGMNPELPSDVELARRRTPTTPTTRTTASPRCQSTPS